MSDNKRKARKSTNSGRSAPRIERPAPNSGRSPLATPKFTAHRFKVYRRQRGRLVREMRKKRGLYQGDLGAPSQIRRFEAGMVAQVATMEILARLVPCPREVLKLLRALLSNLPVACVDCRAKCELKRMDESGMIAAYCRDITMEPAE